MGWWRRWMAARKRAAEIEAEKKYEELRRISDDFGAGPILRYGEDRYGKGSK